MYVNHNPNVYDAINGVRRELIARYRHIVQDTFDRFVRIYGENLDGARSTEDAIFYDYYLDLALRAKNDMIGAKKFLASDKLMDAAIAYADSSIESWAYRILEKYGDIQYCKLTHFSVLDLTIEGRRQGRKVEVRQTVREATNKKGERRDVYMLRAYVDGVLVSDKKYREIFSKPV